MTVDDCKVVIEDKINLPADDAQTDKYLEALKDVGSKKVIGVFYKPISQWRFSEKYFTFKRDVLFSIFNPYKTEIDSGLVPKGSWYSCVANFQGGFMGMSRGQKTPQDVI